MHAGGRDVLQALRERIGLSVDDLRYSAAILDEYGNMSSAFVYFVLKDALEDNAPPGWWWMSAFGAGFTCHGALLAGGCPRMSDAILTRRVEAETLDHLREDDPRAIRSRRDLRRINRIMGNFSIIDSLLNGSLVASAVAHCRAGRRRWLAASAARQTAGA